MDHNLTSTLSQYDKIILVGGGTGGHIQPIVSLVHGLDNEAIKYLWIGGDHSTEEKTATENNIEFQSIPTLKLATTRSWRSLLYPFYLMAGFWRARQILRSVIARHEAIQSIRNLDRHTPLSLHSRGQEQLCLFSKGGPGSVAIGLAACSLSIPLYIHESDTIPGRSNRILGRFADMIFLGFESASRYFDANKCEVVGQILDPVFGTSFVKEMSVGRRISSGKQNKISPTPLYKEGTNWKTTKPHILVICGSQGSQVIFEEIVKNYSENNEYEWVISLGKLNISMKRKFEKLPDCQALEWISQPDIAHLIQDTDLAITRGSATTLAELTCLGDPKTENQKPKTILIIVPLPYSANNHQYYNALEYEKMGHLVLEQKNLHQLTETIQHNVGHTQ